MKKEISPNHDLPAEVLRLAEHLNTYLPLRRSDVRIETDRYVIALSSTPGPYGTVVQRLRLQDEDVADAVAEVRAYLLREKRLAATWEVGPSAMPADLSKRLKALGMVPAPEPLAIAMVLFEVPIMTIELPSDLHVSLVTTLDDFRRSQEIFWECFGFAPDDAQAAVEKDFLSMQRSPHWLRFLAWQQDRAIAAADATLTDYAMVLSGAATLSEMRGHGAYHVLLLSRWKEAVSRNIPYLVTQAGAMSQPILARLGFREVARISIFLDEQR